MTNYNPDMSYEDAILQDRVMLKELLARPSYFFDDASRKLVPQRPGVYVIRISESKKVIYVGKTKHLRTRLFAQHRRGNIGGSQFRKKLARYYGIKSESAINRYVDEYCSYQFIEREEAEDRVVLEHFATAVLRPILNILVEQ